MKRTNLFGIAALALAIVLLTAACPTEAGDHTSDQVTPTPGKTPAQKAEELANDPALAGKVTVSGSTITFNGSETISAPFSVPAGVTVVVKTGETLTVDAAVTVASGGTLDMAGPLDGTGTIVVHSGGTVKSGGATIVSPANGSGTFQPEAGGSVTLGKDDYSIAGKVNLKDDFSLDGTKSFTVPDGAELVVSKKITLGALSQGDMAVESGGVITLGEDGELELVDGADMALNGEVRVEDKGKIIVKDFMTQVLNNTSASVLINSGGQGTMDSLLFVGSATDPGVFMALDDSSSFHLTESEFLITGTLTIMQMCVLRQPVDIRIAANSTLAVSAGIPLFLESGPPLFGTDATSLITIGTGGAIKLLPNDDDWKSSAGTYNWVPASSTWTS
jgi:hypothetical protein